MHLQKMNIVEVVSRASLVILLTLVAFATIMPPEHHARERRSSVGGPSTVDTERKMTINSADATGPSDKTPGESYLSDISSSSECPCKTSERPELWHKTAVARWMVHTLDWGIVSTLSTRDASGSSDTVSVVRPFGNVYSFVDGTCDNSTGIPFFTDRCWTKRFKTPRSRLLLH
jgi:Pyridoxamine 5'-phosphate oxidase